MKPFSYTQRRRRRAAGAAVIASAAAAAALLFAARPDAATMRLFLRAPDAATIATQRARTPSGMVYIPGGEFLAGTNDEDADDDQKPQVRRFVATFYLDRTEVTNQQYRNFRADYVYPGGEDNLPVTNVTYAEAEAYAKGVGKRLPTENEWEKAARGTDGRRFPWGDTWDTARVASRRSRTEAEAQLPEIPLAQSKTPNACLLFPSRVRPVGSVPGGVSPYGAVDMAGNAWEWVQGFYNGNKEMRILRGGAVGYGERGCRTYNRAIEGAGVT